MNIYIALFLDIIQSSEESTHWTRKYFHLSFDHHSLWHCAISTEKYLIDCLFVSFHINRKRATLKHNVWKETYPGSSWNICICFNRDNWYIIKRLDLKIMLPHIHSDTHSTMSSGSKHDVGELTCLHRSVCSRMWFLHWISSSSNS